jgi:hypothetical protein
MKDYGEWRSLEPHALTKHRLLQPLWKSPISGFNRKVGGPHSLSGRSSVDKNLLFVPKYQLWFPSGQSSKGSTPPTLSTLLAHCNCYEILRNIPSEITASVTIGYCSLPLNWDGIFVPSNLKFATFFMTLSHLRSVRYLWQVFKGRRNGVPISARLSSLILYCVLYLWNCWKDSDEKPWLLAARSDLDSRQGQWE